MKRIIASLLAVMMLCSMVMVVSAIKPNEEMEVLKFTNAPKIDGVITEAEWGKPSAKVNVDYKTAAYLSANRGSGGLEEVDATFDLWLRWDAKNYYIGITTPDDIHALAAGEGDLWNGDVIQMGFDPHGPISSGDVMSPWTKNDMNGYTNMAFGLVSGEGNTLSSWAWAGPVSVGPVEGAKYNIKRNSGITTYEIAIPWETLAVSNPKVGDLFGATIVRVFCNDEEEDFNGFLTWGTGIIGPQAEETACGSNGIRLSATTVGGGVAVVEPETDTPAPAPDTADPFTAIAVVMAVSAGAALSLKKRR